MAKATRQMRDVIVTKQEQEAVYVLELTQDEADTLRLVCGRIGGSHRETRRGDMASISAALDAAGLRHYGYGHPDISGGITFSGRSPVVAK